MLTREEITKKLEENIDWELPMEATDEEFDLYEEVRKEVAKKKGLPIDEDDLSGDFDDDLDLDDEEI
ncbi:MAG: hypothetical protein WC243_02100 [Patescibacteria group bacterium]|jgi:hypothetical protein